MVRSGVWIEDSVIPYVAVDPNENAVPLNAYLYEARVNEKSLSTNQISPRRMRFAVSN
jgi:hypothetical protein